MEVCCRFKEKSKFLDGSSKCETAYLTVKCYLDTDPDIDINMWFNKDNEDPTHYQ